MRSISACWTTKGCLTCHTFNPEAEGMEAFEDANPLTFASNFQAMQKTVCTTCHTSERAGDTCLTCHNYHVGTVAPVLPNAPLTLPSPPTKENCPYSLTISSVSLCHPRPDRGSSVFGICSCAISSRRLPFAFRAKRQYGHPEQRACPESAEGKDLVV